MSAEKQEFNRLAALSGWTNAELARRLKVTPPHITGLMRGGKEPSASLVELLCLVLQRDKPEIFISHASPEVRPVAQILEELRRADPAAFKTVESVIITYHREAKKKPAANLTGAETIAAASASSAARAAGLSTAPSPSPATGAPTVHKRAPVRGTARRSSRAPAPPAKAPK